MRGLFIPEITAEMFRNGCLESVEALMAKGEIYDIEYSKWIPVSERLPEIKRDVLVYLKNGRFFVAALFPGSEGHEHWWIGEEEIHFAFNEVDGWMPLPEPYRTIARFEPTGKFHKCRCSACKTEFEEEMFYDNPVFKFCPNCAARMEVDR